MKNFKALFSILVVAVAFLITVRPAHAVVVVNPSHPFDHIINHIVNFPNDPQLTDPDSTWYSFGIIVKPNTQYVKTVASVDVNGVSLLNLWKFTGNPLNSSQWYPGVISDVLVHGNGGPGSIYNETLNFFGTTFTDQVYIAGAIPLYYKIENSINGPINSSGILIWKNTTNGAKLTLHGLVPIPAGFDVATFRALLQQSGNQAFTNVLNHFNTTGTINYSDELYTTPNF